MHCRFTLWRRLTAVPSNRICAFVMLNPSTADDTVDDPTIRRCKGFAHDWGFDALHVVNTNPVRSTDPHACPMPNPTALACNDAVLRSVFGSADMVVCAWGNNVDPALAARTKAILLTVAPSKAYHLGLTAQGHPKHPLYLRADTKPVRWSIPQ